MQDGSHPKSPAKHTMKTGHKSVRLIWAILANKNNTTMACILSYSKSCFVWDCWEDDSWMVNQNNRVQISFLVIIGFKGWLEIFQWGEYTLFLSWVVGPRTWNEEVLLFRGVFLLYSNFRTRQWVFHNEINNLALISSAWVTKLCFSGKG